MWSRDTIDPRKIAFFQAISFTIRFIWEFKKSSCDGWWWWWCYWVFIAVMSTCITQFSNFYGKYVNLKAAKWSSLDHFFWMHNQKWVHEMAHRKPFQQMSGINSYMMELQWIIAQFHKEYHYCTSVLKDELQPHTHTKRKPWHTWKSFFSHYHFKWTGHQRNMKCFTVEQSTEKNEAK